MDECNKEVALNKWSRLFNAIIENWELKELEMPGRRYTWSNNHVEPTLKKLDRVLFSLAWEQLYPLVSLKVLAKEMSDHAPLIVNLGLDIQKIVRPFKFELCWFLREDLVNVVSKVWNDFYSGKSRIDKWQNRGRKLRKVLKGWNLNYVWFYKKQKKLFLGVTNRYMCRPPFDRCLLLSRFLWGISLVMDGCVFCSRHDGFALHVSEGELKDDHPCPSWS